MSTLKIIYLAGILLSLTGCMPKGFEEETNRQFGDQHFKTAIALIELHKIREGQYPVSLDSLKYLGDWDKIIFMSTEYQKLDSGYELNLIKGFNEKPKNLHYPDDFWNGLGIKKSNLMNKKE